MNRAHREILLELRRSIVDQIDVWNGIVQPLIVENIITVNDITNLADLPTRKQRVELLLDILPDRGQRAFFVFLAALNQHYNWLRMQMINSLTQKTYEAER